MTGCDRRRRREVIRRPDGTAAVQINPPRADVLTYPGTPGLITVLVRRTHDVEMARLLAAQRWAQHRAEPAAGRCGEQLLAAAGLFARYRVGWWTTTPPGVSRVPPHAAVDEQHRVVRWATGHERGSGPGVEFRP